MYGIGGDGSEYGVDSHSDALDYTEKLGFQTNDARKRCATIDEVIAYIEKWTRKDHRSIMRLTESL